MCVGPIVYNTGKTSLQDVVQAGLVDIALINCGCSANKQHCKGG